MEEPEQNQDFQQYITIADQEYGALALQEPLADLTAITSPAPALGNSQALKVRKLVMLNIQENVRLFSNQTVRFCLASFFVKRVAFASESFVFQYASEKFLWPLDQTTFLRVATASGGVFATLIACPISSLVLRGKGFTAHKIDLNTVRISLIVVLVSFFWAWKANSGLILALGTLQEVPMMSYRLMLIMNNSNDWLWAW